MTIRVLRISHGARDPQHRGRDRALVAAGVELTLVVPSEWPEGSSEVRLSPEPFRVVELPVRRPGDMNRHAYLDGGAIQRLIDDVKPEVLDIHAEPFSAVGRQSLLRAPASLPVVMYTAQNVDKRFPPPFANYERAALRRVAALYPCSRQAASVARGKGFGGTIDVLPLGYDDTVFRRGSQALDSDEIVLMLVGRIVPEKGAADAVRVLASVHATRPARLLVCGSGPDEKRTRDLAESLGVADRLDVRPWQSGSELAAAYREAHIVLVPSRPTERWVEQFGRVIVEAQASGAVVVGYASGAIPEVAGDAGVLVETGDVNHLAHAVNRVLSRPDEFAWRREAGCRRASTQTWGHVAERQVALYRAAPAAASPRLALPRSPRRRRALARREFGPTASTLGGVRPFALPILRRGGVAPRALAIVVDAAAELRATVAFHVV